MSTQESSTNIMRDGERQRWTCRKQKSRCVKRRGSTTSPRHLRLPLCSYSDSDGAIVLRYDLFLTASPVTFCGSREVGKKLLKALKREISCSVGSCLFHLHSRAVKYLTSSPRLVFDLYPMRLELSTIPWVLLRRFCDTDSCKA